MKFTNKQNLPQPYYSAVANDDYDSGVCDYTPSSLIRPPYMARLLRDHNDEIEVDVADRFYSLMGQMAHKLLETADTTASTEVRIYKEFQKWVIGMKYDRLYIDKETAILQDWKMTTSYKFTKDFNGNYPEIDEWEIQLNIGAYILRNGGYTIERKKEVPFSPQKINQIEIVGLIRDWQKKEADNNHLYPQHPVIVRGIRMWSDKEVESYLSSRCQEHDDAMKSPSIEYVKPCTPKEMWQRPDRFALMKFGNKRAVKLFDSQSAISKHITENNLDPKKHFIEPRPGERIRCERGYCDVAKFCLNFNQSKES